LRSPSYSHSFFSKMNEAGFISLRTFGERYKFPLKATIYSKIGWLSPFWGLW
jgi:hypothetical protein